jgi:c-di-GMP-binding flagellar brake protein YcgR
MRDLAIADDAGVTAQQLSELPDQEAAFLLHARADIVAVLRDIEQTRTLVHVHFGAGHDSLLTALIALDTAAGEFLIDCSGSPKLNRRLLQAHRLLFYTALAKVQIRFTSASARRVEHEGREAFAVRLPETMLRLQRRECYRLLAPVTRPIRCIVPVTRQQGVRYVETRVHDISQGGVSIVAPREDIPAEPGHRYPNCRLVLPDTGSAVVTLETVFECELPRDDRALGRIGCRYVSPSMPALATIQRHMMKLEREQMRRSRFE